MTDADPEQSLRFRFDRDEYRQRVLDAYSGEVDRAFQAKPITHST